VRAQIEINDEEIVVYLRNATVTVCLGNTEDYLVAVNRSPYNEGLSGRTETIPRRLKQKGKLK
jgi:hypothetical protein